MTRAMRDSSGMLLFEDPESKNILSSRQARFPHPAPIINFWYVLLLALDVTFWNMVMSVKLEYILKSRVRVLLHYIAYP